MKYDIYAWLGLHTLVWLGICDCYIERPIQGLFWTKNDLRSNFRESNFRIFLEVHAYAHAIIQFPQSDVSSYITAISKKFSTSYKV